MRRLMDVVVALGAGRGRGVIHAGRPWSGESLAVVHDPRSVLGPPVELEPFLDADLAFEYLRAWGSWQAHRPGRAEAADALVAFAARTATGLTDALPRSDTLAGELPV